ncbi:MAG: GDP-L-fucose synthase [Sphaerochaetaceae bacterium]|nr:GDP-L-fucose synthase [Sphaerochaetaceae bacterium]
MELKEREIDLSSKRITLTGGNGFLGSFVLEELKKQGAKNIFVPSSKEYDLTTFEACKKVAKDSDIIIHLAAKVGGIGANQEHPGDFFYDNLMMGVQLIEQARLANVEKFVAIGTICAYPKFTLVPFKESDLWNGYPEETNAPYGLAKKMLLVQLQAYKQQYGFNGIYLLPVNLYGPRDNFDPNSSHVIPALIRKISEAKKNNSPSITVWGDGSASREFLFVKDAAKGIVLATKYYNKTDPVNLGSGNEITIKNLVELLCELMGFDGEIIWDKSKPNGQPKRCLEVSKAKKEFDFEATTNLREGLKETIDWYLKINF